jgi:DNA polymerase-3 subunit beta
MVIKMKLKINKRDFMKSWSMAEHCAATVSSANIFSTVLIRADFDGAEMRSTDIKTAITCKAGGITVIEPGAVALPIKGVSDLFGKIGSDEFSLDINEGRAAVVAGKNRYRFSTYPASDFPKLPTSAGAEFFFLSRISDIRESVECGMMCASVKDEMPQYLSSVFFDMQQTGLSIVSTNGNRLALSKTDVDSVGEITPLLLPASGVRGLLRVFSSFNEDVDVRVLLDETQAYFVAGDIEYAVRRTDSKFPPYTRILPQSYCTSAKIARSELLAALERVDVVVRDSNRTVVMTLDADGCVLFGEAPEFGEAVERLPCQFTGEPLRAGFQTKFFMEGVKSCPDPCVEILFGETNGSMSIRASDSERFVYLMAPVELGANPSPPTDAVEY